MSTEIAVKTDLTISETQTTFTDQQVAMLQQLGLEGVSDGDLAVFFHRCRVTGLDPFLNEISMIGRNVQDNGQWKKRYTVQVNVAGQRKLADRTNLYEGVTAPEWADGNGHWLDYWPYDLPPVAARAGVRRKGWPEPVVATVMWREYAQTKKDGSLTSMWASKPAMMLAKCLPGRARITTDQGVLPIGQIVRDRLPVHVRSINLETGQEEWAPVVNWWRNGATDQWVRIWAPNGTHGSRCIRITTDHPIWTPSGWRKADQVTVGDLIAVTSPTLSTEQDQVILGGLLGDGHLGGRQTGNNLPYYGEAHAVAQEGYLRWKASALSNFQPTINRTEQSDGAGGRHPTVVMRTVSAPALRQFRGIAPVERLGQLTDLGVAVWIMDDGSLKSNRRKTEPRPYLRLYCCGFGAEFAYAAVEFFRTRYGIEPKVYRPSKNPYLQFTATDMSVLLPSLASWLRYDVESNDKQWIAGPIPQGSTAGIAFVPVSRVDHRSGGEPEGRYDIEVQGTHTFVYNNVVVSNCARAAAFREAFPIEFAGLYIEDEMPAERPTPAVQARPGDALRKAVGLPVEPVEPDVEMITPAQLQKLHIQFKEQGLGERADALAWVSEIIGHELETTKALTIHEASHLISTLEERTRKAALDD